MLIKVLPMHMLCDNDLLYLWPGLLFDLRVSEALELGAKPLLEQAEALREVRAVDDSEWTPNF
ncbi:hypothetical protein scyTo_0025877, partial [Scyliorhinus torazame]|nr:hypothetical protein [Scyliorhinus torazame]